MIVFVEPSTGQVMARYTHDTDSKVWDDLGYERAVVNDPQLQAGLDRNYVVTVVDGVVTNRRKNVNPIQPTPSPVKAERAAARKRVVERAKTDPDLADLVTALGIG